MRIIFMGSPDFAVPTLDALVQADHEVVTAYTQPPRPAGRDRDLEGELDDRAARRRDAALAGHRRLHREPDRDRPQPVVAIDPATWTIDEAETARLRAGRDEHAGRSDG